MSLVEPQYKFLEKPKMKVKKYCWDSSENICTNTVVSFLKTKFTCMIHLKIWSVSNVGKLSNGIWSPAYSIKLPKPQEIICKKQLSYCIEIRVFLFEVIILVCYLQVIKLDCRNRYIFSKNSHATRYLWVNNLTVILDPFRAWNHRRADDVWFFALEV